MDFYSGAFRAKRNGTLSSLFEFNLKQARKDNIGYKAVIGLDDMQLVGDGKRDPFALGTIAQSAVQILYFFHTIITGADSSH